ncbi:MAG: LysR family transcriptional regulator [Sphingomonadales bacterium]|jgi:DNA-binding transcriptional LysR family regulator
MDRLTAMEIFVKVIKEGSFSAAARSMNMSKSAVSKYVSELEDRLGARLLNRTTRRLSVTDVGRVYFERCQQILSDVMETETAISEDTRKVSGQLRVAAPVTFSVKHLGGPLSEFLGQYPEVDIDLNLNDRRADIVEEGFDVAVRISRQMTDSSLIAAKLATSRAVTCASPAYLDRHGTPQTPQELVDHNCLRYSNIGPVQEWYYQDENKELISVRVSGTISANNGEVLREAALDGQGIITGPSFITGDAIKSGKLVPILQPYAYTDFGIFAVYPHNRHLSAKVRVFVDFLKSHWGADPYWNDF